MTMLHRRRTREMAWDAGWRPLTDPHTSGSGGVTVL